MLILLIVFWNSRNLFTYINEDFLLLLFRKFDRYLCSLYSVDRILETTLMGILWRLDKPHKQWLSIISGEVFSVPYLCIVFMLFFIKYIIFVLHVLMWTDLMILYIFWSFNKSVIFTIICWGRVIIAVIFVFLVLVY